MKTTVPETIAVPSLVQELAEMKPTVIVEPGGTHEGKLRGCYDHIRWAAEAGAQKIKFQWLSSPLALAVQRNAPEYTEAYRNIAFPTDWHVDFRDRCHALGMEYGCSVYLKQDIEVVGPHVDFFKVSSFESADLDLLRLMSIYDKPIYLSLGMRSEHEARSCIRQALKEHLMVPVYFLYCVTGYPVPTAQLNLSVLQSNIYHGFSDHSADVTVGARAYAAGARIFEVHTRLPTTPATNPDYAVALPYAVLATYIEYIHEQAVYFGTRARVVQPIERTFLPYKR